MKKDDGFPLLHSSFLLPSFPVLANGSMSSHQSGACKAGSAHRNWATNSQGLGRQRDIRQKLMEAGLSGGVKANNPRFGKALALILGLGAKDD